MDVNNQMPVGRVSFHICGTFWELSPYLVHKSDGQSIYSTSPSQGSDSRWHIFWTLLTSTSGMQGERVVRSQ